MKCANRLCLFCGAAFEADPRNAYHQKYCPLPACRKASKAASQHVWISKPENQDYHSGPDAVARVRDWQNAHPEYRERQKARRVPALQDHCHAQVAESTSESAAVPNPAKITDSALQDFIEIQPHVIVGLIAHLFNITLQDDISAATHVLQRLGEDIANGRAVNEFLKAGHLSGTPSARTGPV